MSPIRPGLSVKQELPKGLTKESIIEKTYSSENLPSPLFALRARLRPGRAHAPEGGPIGRRPKRGNSVRRQSPNTGLGVSNAALDGGASLWQREGRRDLSSVSIQLWTD